MRIKFWAKPEVAPEERVEWFKVQFRENGSQGAWIDGGTGFLYRKYLDRAKRTYGRPSFEQAIAEINRFRMVMGAHSFPRSDLVLVTDSDHEPYWHGYDHMYEFKIILTHIMAWEAEREAENYQRILSVREKAEQDRLDKIARAMDIDRARDV